MPDPLFSIVVATWNRAPLLPRALDSITGQAFSDWEAVVVDDGSTDETPAVIRRYAELDPRFTGFRIDHGGISVARNTGIRKARGAWVTFLDSDDRWETDHLASRVRFIAAHPELEFIHGGFRIDGPPETHFVADARDPTRLIPVSECAVGGTFVVKRPVLESLGGFPDVPYAMDFDLLNRAVKAGIPIGRCPAPTYIYVREPGEGMCEERRP
jgi:glycosyltransferase involved in cell wall biosynthesis